MQSPFPISPLLLLGLFACGGDSEETATTTGITTTGESGTSTVTTTTFPTDCADWSVEMTQEFTWEDLFGSDTLEGLPNEQGPGVALGDLDGDGDLDAILAVGRSQSIGFRNDGTGAFEKDATITVDGEAPPHANSVALADLDGDGDLDGVLARGLGFSDLLIINDGTGAFSSTELPSSEGERVSPAFADINGDGNLDIFVAGFENFIDNTDVQSGSAEGDNSSFYIQIAPGEFEDRTEDVPPAQQPAFTYQGAFIDYDGDNDMDLYTSNDFGNLVVPNAMFNNDGTGIFKPDNECSCAYGTTAMGGVVGDLNNDHYPDLFVTDWGFNWFLMHDGTAGFIEAQQVYNMVPNDKESEVGWGAAIADLNRDTYEDVAIPYGSILPDQQTTSTTQADAVLLGDGSGDLLDVSKQAGFRHRGIGRTAAVGDLNRDGRPDIVVSGRVYLAIFLAQGGCDYGLTLTLNEGSGNNHGFGAKVLTEIGDRTFTKWMLPSQTFGASAPEMYVGLGSSEKADSITVTWTDGTQQVLTDLASGQHTITKE